MIGDRVVNNVAPKDRDVAMVFQSYALYPHMTVFNNIAFPLKAQRRDLNKEQRWELVRRAAAIARETLDAEQKKFQLGVSTDYNVILRQRDLATAEGNEIQAKATLLEAIVAFNQAIGRTLQVHNISVADAATGHVTNPPLIPGTPIKSFSQYSLRQGRR